MSVLGLANGPALAFGFKLLCCVSVSNYSRVEYSRDHLSDLHFTSRIYCYPFVNGDDGATRCVCGFPLMASTESPLLFMRHSPYRGESDGRYATTRL